MNESASVLIPLMVFAYLLGSVPSGVLVAKIFGAKDPRDAGSGNIGATNVSRSAGKTAGIVTLVLDILKGAVPTLVALYVVSDDSVAVSLTALSAFTGHLYPVFLKFKGGKGVATACGIFLVLSPVILFISLGVFIVLVALTRYVSVGSIAAVISIPVMYFLYDKTYFLLGVAVAILATRKHAGNIDRLIKGTENRFGKKKSKAG